MKRKNKCVASKRAYATTDECLAVMKRVYKQKKVKLWYYECPVCLDFHLTSKGSGKEMYEMQKLWRDESMKRDIANKYKEFCRLFNKMNREYNKATKKPKTTLKGILPREDRLRILAEMKANQNPYIWGKIKNWFKSAV